MLKPLFLITLVATVALSASGATITNFRTYTNAGTIPTSPLAPTFNGSTANLGNATVSCLSTTGCNAIAFAFTLDASGYDPTQILSASLGGNLSGTTPASGTLSLSGNYYSLFAFSIPTGNFETSIFSTTEPITGSFADISFFSLTLAPGQVLTLTDGLTLSFSSPTFTPAAVISPQVSGVPEPGSLGLLAAGLTGFIILTCRRIIEG